MSEAAPAPPPGSQELRPTNVFLSAGLDAGEWVEQIRHAFQAAGPGYQVVKYSANLPLTDGEFDPELRDVDAAIVLLSPGYLSTYQAISTEYPAIVRHEREDGLPVFRVAVTPDIEGTLEKLSIDLSQLVIDTPLQEMDEAERGHTLALLVRNVETALAGTRRTEAHAESEAGSEPLERSADIRRDDASEPASESPNPFEQYRFTALLSDVLKLASEYADSAPSSMPVSTSTLLLSLMAFGARKVDTQWGGWLYRRIGDENFPDLFQQFFDDYQIKSGARYGRPTTLTAGTAMVLTWGRAIAQLTKGTDEIDCRHLIAALLTDKRGAKQSGALRRLEMRGFAATDLRKEFFDVVRGKGDDDAQWSKILLGRELRVYRMAGFHADDTRGEDLLGIEQDVLAFATLIAAHSVTPPLSIGLFGEWGSGKSFFMRHLRNAVAGLARDAARSGQMQRDLPFYKRIVQIEFNAWHYVEGNLWASLVEHIFHNLKIPGDPPSVSEALQQRLMDGVEFTGKVRAQANEEVQRAQREVDAARERVSAAELEHERQRDALAELAAKEVASDLTVKEVRAAVGPVLERLGASTAEAGVHELLGALSDARTLMERGRSVFLPLVRAPKGERRRRTALLLMVMFLGPAIYWLVGAAVGMLGDAAMAQLSAFASGAAALLTAGAVWVRSQVKWGSDRLAEVEKAQREVDRRLAEKQAEQTRELRALQERLRLAQADYEAARRSELESEKRAAEARAKLEDSSVARLVASFIEDRAASTDYRKHLGVLALVRNDFETLSGLIEEENWRLSPPGHDDDRYPHTTRFKELEEEGRQAESRINRIVLYIDDLDRCPPNKVVEVLQAVHLLLAFPLFVVVVGVDARWVKRSLEVRYRELLHGGDAQAKDSVAPAELLIGKATTDDYLEKIFQVPFWLRPMDETHTGRMVRSLLEGSVAAPASAQASTQAAEGSAQHEVAASSDALLAETARHVEDRASPPVEQAGGVVSPRDVVKMLVDAGQPRSEERQEEPQVNLESLVFHHEEMEFIAVLAPLLDRSPRALKRFVNVYRLIKAGLTLTEQRAFVGADGPYRAVLFLLAVDTGLPGLADRFFAALRTVSPESPATLLGLMRDKTHSKGLPGDGLLWARVSAWLRPHPNDEPRFDAPLALLAEWEPRVMRYSFRAQG
jgi:hypothetical protein